MGLSIDRFTWAVIGVVALLLIGAVATVSLSGGAGWGEEDYLPDGSPEATVHNAYLALMRNEIGVARSYYSSNVRRQADDRERYPGGFSPSYADRNDQRLRILSVELEDDERAYVTVAVDHYNTGGLFGSGETWTNRSTLILIREEGAWKIDTLEFFY